ncbi:SCO1/SenC/PrrC family protein [Natrialba magadii ATCC 43099]|uniref:Electron transporter SCO1/SenC n=1 Tax=Natrialba magadii (strain ATCC 43099 / DSM 3394 / CCM 3739 / CIP 104546 / IAM 13178 / JCM 8861 / NBRC 102185 / NCIMB 2190 / MS3) TaxID=547559 RepID=D3T019_NATMM|nr:SCO family protein [Natrialba magadii]ADD04377.1 SCO1/SenC/PrrC family protein [Natrialba magadii ATCC 43099]ELY26018.1 electron transporter SCO1/SenC [Natrialba magadii ATCC 43099]
MNRRRALTVGVTTGLTAVAGCLTGMLDDESSEHAVLAPPEEDIQSESLYPTYGDPFPAFELEDPIGETTVDVSALEDALVVTAFFASCPDECVPLMNSISQVQTNAAERGLGDETRILAITFDPERDTGDALQDHSDTFGINYEADNWHYLRPEDHEMAQSVVYDDLGIPFEREELGDEYDFMHITVTFLVNPNGYVERAYRGDDPDPVRITDDLEQVLDGHE